MKPNAANNGKLYEAEFVRCDWPCYAKNQYTNAGEIA